MLKTLLIRAAGGGPLLDACEFYATHPGDNLRGTVGRWAPGVHPAPQPQRTAHGEPSMWDNGSIARWALGTIGTGESPT